MDTQACEIRIESYEHSSDHISYYWYPNAHERPFAEDAVTSPEYRFVRFQTKKVVRREGNINRTTNNYDHLILEMVLARRIGYYVISVYWPLISIVMVRISRSSIEVIFFSILE